MEAAIHAAREFDFADLVLSVCSNSKAASPMSEKLTALPGRPPTMLALPGWKIIVGGWSNRQ
jgi:hypothetical protein